MNALGRTKNSQTAHQRGMAHTHAKMLYERRTHTHETHTHTIALGGDEWHAHGGEE